MNPLFGFGDQLLVGVLTTLRLALSALLLGSLFGVVGCLLQRARNRVLRALGHGYSAVIRGVPDLLVVFAVYFGGPLMLTAMTGRSIEIDAFLAGVLALALSFGAYAAEIARGALAAVPMGQREAAATLGLTTLQSLWTVVAPQAARAAIAPFGNQSIVLLKQTAIVSIVGCDELMRKAAEAAGATREPFTMYLACAFIYLSLTFCASQCLDWAERRAVRAHAH